jgi:hypothetical protein
MRFFVAVAVLFFAILGVYPVTVSAAEGDVAETIPSIDGASAKTPRFIQNNRYLQESHRRANAARLSFNEGDYDRSEELSGEAVSYAKLSDDWIEEQLKALAARKAIAAADERVDWAEKSGAAAFYKKEVDEAKGHLGAAKTSRATAEAAQRDALAGEASQEEAAGYWDDARLSAGMALAALADVAAPPPEAAAKPPSKQQKPTDPEFKDQPKKPALYKVRAWDVYGDCLWNIADWFYNNPWRWKELYAANKHKLPDPENPNWIEVGTIIEIPGVDGEARAGTWDTGRPFQAP